MDIRKNLILLLILFIASIPVQASQFKRWQGTIINKQAITHIAPYGYKNDIGIRVFYMSGNSLGRGTAQREASFTELKYSSKEKRDQILTQFVKWLNERD